MGFLLLRWRLKRRPPAPPSVDQRYDKNKAAGGQSHLSEYAAVSLIFLACGW